MRVMTDPRATVVPEPPMAGTEIETLLGSLDRQRTYLEWKCGRLDQAGMRATLGPSAVTLGGLLKHLALMEDTNFSWPGRARTVAPWNCGHWDADPDWEWHSASEDTPEALLTLWRESVARSRAVVDEALAEGGLDHQAHFALPNGPSPSLRRQLIDMIEEYARHVGQADLIRESVDGLIGEDPRD
jgi:hypothetical protein